MLSQEENDLLTRVEGDAPMGQLMRRHWIPVCLIEEVAEPDGDPVRLRILGDELVAFRDTEGRVAVMDGRCPHRGALLFLGRNEECGLTCLFHGWKIDVEGKVAEMASEPGGGPRAGAVTHTSYPVREAGGFVWAYLGPAETMPEFQRPAFAPDDDVRVSILKIKIPCNWAQILEGAIDSSHSSTLHQSDMVPADVRSALAEGDQWYRPSTDKSPRMQIERTDYGMHYAAIRTPTQDPETHDYVRVTEYIAPFVALIPPNNMYNVVHVNVPSDDETTYFYFIAWGKPETTIATDEWRRFCHAVRGEDLEADWSPKRTLENAFLQDRYEMRRGSFTGIPGIPNQDIAVWTSQGPIADRTRDRLGASDLAIAEFRKMMIEAAREMAATGKALGAGPGVTPQVRIRSSQAVVPKSTDWRHAGLIAAE